MPQYQQQPVMIPAQHHQFASDTNLIHQRSHESDASEPNIHAHRSFDSIDSTYDNDEHSPHTQSITSNLQPPPMINLFPSSQNPNNLSAQERRQSFQSISRATKSTGAVEQEREKQQVPFPHKGSISTGTSNVDLGVTSPTNDVSSRKNTSANNPFRRQRSSNSPPTGTNTTTGRQGRSSLSNQPSTEPTKNSLYIRIGISAYQMRLVQQSWPNIYATGSSALAKNVISKLCEVNPNVKAIFMQFACCDAFSQTGRDTRQAHSRYILDMIDTVVNGLVQPISDMNQFLNDQGAAHSGIANFNRNTIWDSFGEIMLEYIRCHNQVRKHKELNRAWLLILTYVVDRLKAGHKNFAPKS